MNKDTGGPAFPGKQKALMVQAEHREIASQYEIEHNGMTLRDYFAAKAMQSVFAEGNFAFTLTDYELMSKVSYAMADAMLKARKE